MLVGGGGLKFESDNSAAGPSQRQGKGEYLDLWSAQIKQKEDAKKRERNE